MRGKRFERIEALAVFREWFSQCGQALAIVGPAQSGKTYFAHQLSELPECVASHFCRCDEPQSSETATLFRSIGEQLMKKFPNLVLPRLSTVTLLKNGESALEHFLKSPLESMPKPAKPVFLIIDNVVDEATRKLVEMIRVILPRWIRIVLTTRKIDPGGANDLHVMTISTDQKDLDRFIRSRLPNLPSSEILLNSQGSWFYVDLLSKQESSAKNLEDLMIDVAKSLPPNFENILKLVKISRNRPTYQQLLAVAQMLSPQEISHLEKDLKHILSLISDSTTSIDIPQPWFDFVANCDTRKCHSAWAEHFKTKRRKNAQDIVELAYHLAHSTNNPMNAVQTLQSVGASQLILKCPVIDLSTTSLLTAAGASISENDFDIVYACSIGNVEMLEVILNEVKPSNMDICFGLLIAAARGHLEMCQFIVDNFPNVAISTCCGEWNALRSAACNGQLEILNLLLSRGIDVDECGNSDRTALRAAAWSGQLAAVQLLLQTGANVDRRDSEQRTALMAAAFMGHRDVVAVILQYGADINATDKSGATALHLNLANGSKQLAQKQTTELLLENSASCTISDANGRVALHLAAYHGDECLPTILSLTSSPDVQDNQGQTPLILAASQGQIEAVKYLVKEASSDIDCIDANGRTALQWAAINGHTNVVEFLCAEGSDEAHKDNDGAIALHYAVAHQDAQLSSFLINEMTVKATDRYGQHPLLVACTHGHLQVISELINRNAPVNLAALDGRTALSVAAANGHLAVCQLLAPYVDDWNQLDHDGVPLVQSLIASGQIRVAELLFGLGTSTLVKDSHGRTCAHVVASTNDISAAKMLRSIDASFETIDDGGRTPLMTSIWSRTHSIAFFLLDTCSVDPNRCDQQGASALSIACQLGDRDLVALLLKFGAEPGLRDSAGRTASDVARISGNDSIINMLRAANGSSDSSGIGSSVPNSPMDAAKQRARAKRGNSLVRMKL